jgi:ribosomal protein L11 methyltransferase
MVEPTSGTVLARLLVSDRETLLRIEDALAEQFEAMASSSGPEDNGCWSLELHFREPPDEERMRTLIGSAAGGSVAERVRFERLPPADWVRKSLTDLRPVPVGRFVVHGSHDRGRIPVNRIAIEIEASLAFGTGHHASTQGCLLAIDLLMKRARRKRRANARHPSRSRREPMLDVGTGSGVLAIAAAKAFRRRVFASDVDTRSVAIARENARLNRVAHFVDVLRAAGLKHRAFRARSPYELIVANILLHPLREMATEIAQLAGPNAHVVISGLLVAQATAALARYRARGLVLARRIALDGWTTLVLQRQSARRSFAGQMRCP